MNEIKVTQEQLDLMRHTIGADYRSKPYRNYFSSGESCDGFGLLCEIVDMGLMERRNSPISSDVLFHLTDKGMHILGFSGLDAISN